MKVVGYKGKTYGSVGPFLGPFPSRLDDVQQIVLARTFNKESDTLPSIGQLHQSTLFDCDRDFSSSHGSFIFRDAYNKHSFVILTDEWIKSLVSFLSEYSKVIELSCGAGWLTYWIRRYGGKIDRCVDNFTFEGIEYTEMVENADSIQIVHETPSTDLYILSWPYMDSVAHNIWQNMKSGQHLLYIGEGRGGCTADDSFWAVVEDKEIILGDKEVYANFRSFWAVHDRPILFGK